jgi:hypothetical protein
VPLGGLRIRQACVTPGRMVKATAEAKVALGEWPTSRPYSPSAPLEMPLYQLRHTRGLGPHPNRDEGILVRRLSPEPGLSDGLHDGTLSQRYSDSGATRSEASPTLS